MVRSGMTRICVVGGGSAYMPGIAYALAKLHDRFEGSTLVLHDIEPDVLDVQTRLTRSILRSRGAASIAVEGTTDLGRAVDGAAFVLTTFRPGGLEARRLDESIPLRYGVIGQETVGPGGLAMAFRSVPVVRRLAAEMRRRAEPHAVLLNYTNPVQIVTEALIRHDGAPIVGLCDQSSGEVDLIAGLMGVDAREVEIDTFGTNHLTWTKAVRIGGVDRTEEVFAVFAGTRPESVDPHWASVIRLFPLYGSIPNLYLQYYALHDEVLERQREGPTRAEEVMALLPPILESYRREAESEDPHPMPGRFSEGHGDFAVSVMATMLGEGEGRFVLNVPNRGAIADLPDDAIVEVPCRVRGRLVQPIAMGRLPSHSAGLVRQVAEHARLAADAAVAGDRDLAVRALALHPLVRTLRAAEAIVDEMLTAHREHLPQFADR